MKWVLWTMTELYCIPEPYVCECDVYTVVFQNAVHVCQLVPLGRECDGCEQWRGVHEQAAAALEPGARGRVPEIVPRRLLEGVLSLGLSRTSA